MKSIMRIVSIFLLLAVVPSYAFAAPTGDAVAALINVTAASWRPGCNANPLSQRMEKHHRSPAMRVTVHYTDTKKNLTRPLEEKLCQLFDYATTKVEGVKRELWGDIPYHFYIAADGQLGEARSMTYKADSNTDYSRNGHLTIVIEGNLADGIKPLQKKKLFALLSALQTKFKIPFDRIGTHRDFTVTDCPGPAIELAVKEFKEIPRTPPRPPRCRHVSCPWKKMSCRANEKLVDLSKPGACCPLWWCERIVRKPAHGERVEDDEDEWDEDDDALRAY